jgi:hypothetical protein
VSPPKLGGVAASEASRRGGSKAVIFRSAFLKRYSVGTTPSAPSARPPLLTQEGTPARILYPLIAMLVCMLLGSLTLGQGAPPTRGGRASEYEVKAGFLMNFLRFIEWPTPPAGQAQEPFHICITGDDPFRDMLDRLVKGEIVNGRPIVVRRISRWQDPCELLFVSASVRDAFRILDQAGTGVLTVGETPGFLKDGGIINFVVEDRRVRFDIDLMNATKGSVRISSRLLSVARTVLR